MKRIPFFSLLVIAMLALWGCTGEPAATQEEPAPESGFAFLSEQFADLKILRYQVPGFESLPLQKKQLIYYLYEAGLSGRDIIWDQNYKYNLTIRRTLEAILRSAEADDSEAFAQFETYAKRVFFSNGIHHHYSNDKILPDFSEAYFAELVQKSDPDLLPMADGETAAAFAARLTPIMFDPQIAPKKVNKNPDVDIVTNSAVNFYEGVTEAEVDAFYAAMIDKSDPEPISYGLNSKLVKENGQIVEKVWKVGGMYSEAIEQVVYWLEKAVTVAENEAQAKALRLLIEYYQTGDLAKFDEYSIAWVADTASDIDVINGFIEVYNDPKGYRGSYESIVQIRDPEASKRIAAIGAEAQWFEDNSPIMDEHKKANVQGISARVINVAGEAGDASPSTPIGINLPNANWIRAQHGSKSVNLANIVLAYEEAAKSGGGSLGEFAFSEEEAERSRQYGSLADNLHTDMHEVIGHASGKLNPGVGTPKETLKNYASTMEEGRADLVALYFLMDQKLVDMGLMPSLEVAKAAYDDYIRNGIMTQLRRIKPGDDIEEDHMRNRAMVSWWVYEQGKADNVIERVEKDGKTFFVIRDYEKLRDLFGQLLRETQRIKSEGDYEAAKALVETYGVKVDPDLHAEVLKRFEKLNLAPYSGFINPVLRPVMNGEEMINVMITYPENFTEQMLYYGEQYGFLPNMN
ncbi:MAG: dihydrofolate reductase [Bacteroidetes bacterium]|nr:MAG: dihydrofolate reductase [Bacteroidota bacterium]